MGLLTKLIWRLIAYRSLGIRSVWAYRKSPDQEIVAFIHLKDRRDRLEVVVFRKGPAPNVPYGEPDFADEAVFRQLRRERRLICVA